MAKYIVTIEGFNDCKVVEFEADTPEDAEEIGRDIFYEECNYGAVLMKLHLHRWKRSRWHGCIQTMA